MEVLARDPSRRFGPLTRAAARSPTRVVEYELVEHQLTAPSRSVSTMPMPAQFSIIHNNLDAAMRAANITGENRHA